MKTRRALFSEVEYLSDLAIRSKSTHGYPQEYLDNCRKALTITEDDVNRWPVIVIEDEDKILGFFALMNVKGENRLEHLWLEPDSMKRGVGTFAFKKIIEYAKELSWQSFRIVADPKAKGFYEKMGAKQIGTTQSKISPDIYLPYFEYLL